MMSHLAAAVPCTCGELFQGSLENEPCLVSCPIEICSTASIREGRSNLSHLQRKAEAALNRLTKEQLPLSICNPLPPGRGYGTSTADIGAVIFAAAGEMGLSLDALQASRLAVSIEPTDSTLFPGLTLFDHRRGSFFEHLGPPPAAKLIIIDPGGGVDSEVFNSNDWRPQLARLSHEHRQAYDLLVKGISNNDLSAIGEAATLSAVLHQVMLYNPLIEDARRLSRETGAVGICRAHSGTLVGLLFDPISYDEAELMIYLKEHLPARLDLRATALAAGGVRFIDIRQNEEQAAGK